MPENGENRRKRSSGTRPKKCRFNGNKYTQKKVVESASVKKLKPKFSEATSEEFVGYRLVDISLLFKNLSALTCCVECHEPLSFKEHTEYGLAFRISIECPKCAQTSSFRSCRMLGSHNNIPDINRRSVFAMRCLGQGLSGLQTFCGLMGLPPPVSQKAYDVIVRRIETAVATAAKESMLCAIEEEKTLSEGSKLTVSGDGSWKTRGHTSQIGVSTLIGSETGKVIDYEVLSSFCKSCDSYSKDKHGYAYDLWKIEHEPQCTKNHEGSAGMMEVSSMVTMFRRSEESYDCKYVEYIGDGDTKTFNAICKAKPYDEPVKKLECVSHIQKRMGTRLRKKKTELKGKKLADGKGISGRGRLTDIVIDNLARYYGNAIRANKDSLPHMQKAIWAIYYHKLSNDNKPIHDFCPKGPESWCKFQQALHDDSMPPYRHQRAIPPAIMQEIKDVFLDLSKPELLRRCLGGKTQNANESFNNMIWRYAPKNSGCGKRIVSVAVALATITFNDGSKGLLKVLNVLGLSVSGYSLKAASQKDKMRIEQSNKRCKQATKEARKNKRQKKTITGNSICRERRSRI